MAKNKDTSKKNTTVAKDQIEGNVEVSTDPFENGTIRNNQDNTTSYTPATDGPENDPSVDEKENQKLRDAINENQPENDNVQPTGVEEWDKENGVIN